MIPKSWSGVGLVLCLSFLLVLTGCPKKTVTKQEPSLSDMQQDAAAAAAAKAAIEKAARDAEAQRRAKEEAAAREAARLQAEEAKKQQAAFEKSLTPQKGLGSGTDGKVFESGMLKDVHFDFDRFDIQPADAEILKANASILKKYPNMRIQIEGHCDDRGTSEYNLSLGERRANSVKSYLVSLGMSPSLISIISFGEERPLDPRETEDARAKNRRGHIVILRR